MSDSSLLSNMIDFAAGQIESHDSVIAVKYWRLLNAGINYDEYGRASKEARRKFKEEWEAAFMEAMRKRGYECVPVSGLCFKRLRTKAGLAIMPDDKLIDLSKADLRKWFPAGQRGADGLAVVPVDHVNHRLLLLHGEKGRKRAISTTLRHNERIKGLAESGHLEPVFTDQLKIGSVEADGNGYLPEKD